MTPPAEPGAARAAARRDGRDRLHPAPAARCERPDAAPPEGRRRRARRRRRATISLEERPAARRDALPWKTFQVRTSSGTRRSLRSVRVVLADPAAFTPPYDHELAAALARAGAEVELVTSRFRFGEAPAPDGYGRRELFYPLSSRLFRRSRLRLPLKAASTRSASRALARAARGRVAPAVAPAPELDNRLFRPPRSRRSSPRTTCCRGERRASSELWRRLLAALRSRRRAQRARTRDARRARVADALRVIPHPVFPSDPEQRDDGRTVLCFGVIRPYKGLGDAIEAVRRLGDARLLVAGDPLEPMEPYRAAARGLDVEWRLGYLPQAEVDRALGEATVARLPVQAGARPERRAAARARRRRARGRLRRRRRRGADSRVRRRPSRPAGRRRGARRRRAASCSPTATRSSEARAGARRAREELTWDAAARAHLDALPRRST